MPERFLSARHRRARTEQIRRTVYLTVLLVAGFLLLLVFIQGQLHPAMTPLSGWPAPSAALCLLLAGLLLSRKVSTQIIDQTVLLTTSLLVLIQLVQAANGIVALTAHLYFSCLFISIAAFTVLPIRGALLYSALVLIGLLATMVRSGQPDVTLLIDTTIALILVGYSSIFGRQITAERTEASVYELLALTDMLTGLDNRHAIYPLLDQSCAEELSRRSAAIVLLDVDHFKGVNDQHGHLIGDQVLREVSRVLTAIVRSGDVVSRWGGEEFLILLRKVNPGELREIGERCCRAVRETPMPQGLVVTVSCGLVHAREAGSVDDWLSRADQRLYQAKLSGRDQAVGLNWEPEFSFT